MKILKFLLYATLFSTLAAPASADFKEAAQMPAKAHKQIEFFDSESSRRTIMAAYKIKEDGLFAAISGSNKSAGLEIGPYWKIGEWNVLATGKFSAPYKGDPSFIAAIRAGIYKKHFGLDAYGSYVFKDGHTLTTRTTPAIVLMDNKVGSFIAGIERTDSYGNGINSETNLAARYDTPGKDWSFTCSYNPKSKSGNFKIRKNFK